MIWIKTTWRNYLPAAWCLMASRSAVKPPSTAVDWKRTPARLMEAATWELRIREAIFNFCIKRGEREEMLDTKRGGKVGWNLYCFFQIRFPDPNRYWCCKHGIFSTLRRHLSIGICQLPRLNQAILISICRRLHTCITEWMNYLMRREKLSWFIVCRGDCKYGYSLQLLLAMRTNFVQWLVLLGAFFF